MWAEAARAVALARDAGVTLATAESLTGGLVCSALIEAPGASGVVKGGIITYDLDAKHHLLGVSRRLLETEGPVSQAVAASMARGARRQTGADIAVATTGAAGPEPHGGKPPGTVVVAVVGPQGERVITVHLDGDRDEVRHATVGVALMHLEKMVSRLPHR
ncbi:CinA family protein [Demequina sp. TTPB684]|uniref:CinA family protein n=1 Tax=unclassified Demequina TaxID=2620311 RepID=UPI001CF15461|nr:MULTISPECIES: CinA family protein [unclassified Demequina]MCB2413729.1 CinA family protein [Demequina sp. TTPB684]UPU89600.1 CinA family protein [Demequina sp. TMPB413]